LKRLPCGEMVVARAFVGDGAYAVAPMMDYTNRWLRYLLRQLHVCPTLYTEMVTANTIVHCDKAELPRFLEYDEEREHPLVLQIGGAEPALVRRAASIAEAWGYDAINLNCGCPSDRVAGSGCFGAALMRDPQLVADCCTAMAEGAPNTPITVKCRIGIADSAKEAIEADEAQLQEELASFIDIVSSRGGVGHFAVHARQAVLGGLSPAQNRQIPPLRHALVHRIAAQFPQLSISINGGIDDLAAAAQQLTPSATAETADGDDSGGGGGGGGGGGSLSGVMVGRAVCARPWQWATADSVLYGREDPAAHRRQVLHAYAAYAVQQEREHPQRVRRLLLAPVLNLFATEPHGKQFRASIDTRAKDPSVRIDDLLLRAAEDTLMPETLDAPPGTVWHRHEGLYLPAKQGGALSTTLPRAPPPTS